MIYGLEPATQANARLAVQDGETTSGRLNVTVLGNPVSGDKANIVISGANASPLKIMVTDLNGRILFQKLVDNPVENEEYVLPLGKNSGLYIIKAGTIKQSVSVKVIKQ